ncbi:MAG: hypothetical protein HY539_04630 [Deltaproteobacteria bacterium]|nr:hypothetical protein [Deltaproteobacteria bacterium]
MRSWFYSLSVFLTLLPSLLFAFPGEGQLPASLDFDHRHSDNFRIEMTPMGGEYFGDKLNHTFIVGGDFQFNLIPSLGISLNYDYSQAGADGTSLLGQSLTNRNMQFLMGGLVATKPAAYAGKNETVEADFYSSLGGGLLEFNGNGSGVGYLGGGMKIRFKKIDWIAWRIDVRGILYSMPNPSGSDFAADLSLMVGPTFLVWPMP